RRFVHPAQRGSARADEGEWLMKIQRLWMIAAIAVCIAAGQAEAENEGEWEGSLSASLTAQTGTNDTINGQVDAEGNRNTSTDEIGLRFNANYGQTRGTQDAEKDRITQNSQALFADWKRIITEDFFWDSRSELSRDSVQNRQVRTALSTGPGLRLWKGDDVAKRHFDISAGVGYRFELFESPSTGDGDNFDEDHFADIVAAFEFKELFFDGRVEFTHTGSFKVPANATDAWVAATELIGAVPLSEVWSLRLSFLLEYQNTVPADTNELLTRTNVGLTYKF
ncbi:MAG: DUF481 domain-containing protein, partial [Myxococcota bacterium]